LERFLRRVFSRSGAEAIGVIGMSMCDENMPVFAKRAPCGRIK
jgi:hypothetical protein